VTQLELCPVQVPEADTQCGQILRAMKRGERLTVAIALTQYGCYALSQRVGELKKMGWPVRSRFIKTNNNAMIKEYWL
jgi:hypothetical protein